MMCTLLSNSLYEEVNLMSETAHSLGYLQSSLIKYQFKQYRHCLMSVKVKVSFISVRGKQKNSNHKYLATLLNMQMS